MTMRSTYERISAGDIAGFGELVADDHRSPSTTEDGEDDVAIKVIVELQAKPGRRDELSSLLERIIAT